MELVPYAFVNKLHYFLCIEYLYAESWRIVRCDSPLKSPQITWERFCKLLNSLKIITWLVFLSLKINIVWGYSDPENRCQVTGKGGPVSSSVGMPEGVFDIPILSKMTPMFIDQKDFFKQVFIFVSITWF